MREIATINSNSPMPSFIRNNWIINSFKPFAFFANLNISHNCIVFEFFIHFSFSYVYTDQVW